MSKELNYFSFENDIKNELSGGGKNLDDKNNERITKKYRKKLLELKKVHDNLLIENKDLNQKNKSLKDEINKLKAENEELKKD